MSRIARHILTKIYFQREVLPSELRMRTKRLYSIGDCLIELSRYCMGCLKKNLNASRPYKHPSVRGENIVGGIIGCEYKTSSWHLNGFPDDGNIGSTV